MTSRAEQQKQMSTLDLWVRAGVDGVRNGGCPACQQVFMIMMLKSEDDSLHFNVRTTSMAKPHPEFKASGCRHLPAVVRVSTEEMYDQLDEILEFLDTTYPAVPLQYFNPEADAACDNIFSRFAWYIKEVNTDPKHLNAELRKLDEYLKSEDHDDAVYLTGNRMTHLDCLIMPKLHHIRVALTYLKQYVIPDDLDGLWTYMRNCYAADVFAKSCPSDQEIILYWADRPDTPNLDATRHAVVANSTPQFSWTVPGSEEAECQEDTPPQASEAREVDDA